VVNKIDNLSSKKAIKTTRTKRATKITLIIYIKMAMAMFVKMASGYTYVRLVDISSYIIHVYSLTFSIMVDRIGSQTSTADT